MVICSCSYITTDDIKAVLNYATEPNEQQVLNMLAWTPECKTCEENLRKQIREILGEL